MRGKTAFIVKGDYPLVDRLKTKDSGMKCPRGEDKRLPCFYRAGLDCYFEGTWYVCLIFRGGAGHA